MSPGPPEPPAPRGRLSIYHPPGRFSPTHNPFGKDVANLQLWRALARHGGFEWLDVLTQQPGDATIARSELLDGGAGAEVTVRSILDQATPAAAGALIRGQPELYDLAWLRRRTVGDRAYSLLGLIHTIAPPIMRQFMAMTTAAPMHPWDALICTSPAVRQGVEAVFDGFGEHLAERTGGRPPPRPSLPIVPLGVDAARFAALADRPAARAEIRARLGVGENDVLALWVGRLSYFEKAFPQPMFKALQQASAAGTAKLHFVMAGWFPGEKDQARYEEAAHGHAPDVVTHVLDGNDSALVGELWAGADLFLSLVDNIQETFGITPLEAMAAGLPVVVSDWDGYRATVRDGVEGFLIPTLGGPAGGKLGETLAMRHAAEIDTYQGYVGAVAQHTAVHIGRCAQAIAELAASKDLRRRMGAAGRARVREQYDWPVIARAYHALVDELAAIRAASPDPQPRRRMDPAKGDPFRDFAHFATATLTLDTRLAAPAGVTADQVRQAGTVALDGAFPGLRATPERCAAVFETIAARPGIDVRELLQAFPVQERRAIELGLVWMAKYGLVDWL